MDSEAVLKYDANYHLHHEILRGSVADYAQWMFDYGKIDLETKLRIVDNPDVNHGFANSFGGFISPRSVLVNNCSLNGFNVVPIDRKPNGQMSDDTVLKLKLAGRTYNEIRAYFQNTGLEFPKINSFSSNKIKDFPQPTLRSLDEDPNINLRYAKSVDFVVGIDATATFDSGGREYFLPVNGEVLVPLVWAPSKRYFLNQEREIGIVRHPIIMNLSESDEEHTMGYARGILEQVLEPYTTSSLGVMWGELKSDGVTDSDFDNIVFAFLEREFNFIGGFVTNWAMSSKMFPNKGDVLGRRHCLRDVKTESEISMKIREVGGIEEAVLQYISGFSVDEFLGRDPLAD
jgi:hypothetical protein